MSFTKRVCAASSFAATFARADCSGVASSYISISTDIVFRPAHAAFSHPPYIRPPLWLQPLSVPISPTRIAAFRKILGSLILGPVFAIDGRAKLNTVLSAVNKASSDEFSLEEADKALEALMVRNEVMYTGGMVYII
jgi:hypothetical protein